MKIDLTGLDHSPVSTGHALLPAQRTARESWVFLRGLSPREEFLSFLVQGSPGTPVDMNAAATRWSLSAQVYGELALTEAGAADGVALRPLPDTLQGPATSFLTDPAVASSYSRMKTTVELVPLDKIVVFQRQINVAYADRLTEKIGQWSEGSPELLDFCIAAGDEGPDLGYLQTGPNSFVFRSASTDARFVDLRLVNAAELAHLPVAGRPKMAVVAFVGYGVNALSVLSVDGRLILSNGSHRAYALMKAGFTHVPAVVQHAAHQEDLAVCAPVMATPESYLASPRPPMLRDYFDERLHESMELAPRAREVEIQIGLRQSDTPRDF